MIRELLIELFLVYKPNTFDSGSLYFSRCLCIRSMTIVNAPHKVDRTSRVDLSRMYDVLKHEKMYELPVQSRIAELRSRLVLI